MGSRLSDPLMDMCMKQYELVNGHRRGGVELARVG